MDLRDALDRFAARLRPGRARAAVESWSTVLPRPITSIDRQDPLEPGAVDVARLARELPVSELVRTAEEYYRRGVADGAEYFLAKPYGSAHEAPDLVISFGQVLAALNLGPGMVVLDFGAGTGWTSRNLSQLGCEVVVCDVSETALDLARALYERNPVAGSVPAPRFLLFDGVHLDLDDASVDRVVCFEALHHTPNPRTVIDELGRVLTPGGRAVFLEPGPNHSRTSQSQLEMRNHTVIENDVLMRDVEEWARGAGFRDVALAVYTSEPFHVSVDGFERFLANRGEARRYVEHHARFLTERRLFVLTKEGAEADDSRRWLTLGGSIAVDLDTDEAARGATVTGSYTLRNTGSGRWLPSDAPVGPVRVGVHLLRSDGGLVDVDFARIHLPGDDGVDVGEVVASRFEIAAPEPGEYLLEFDLVADGVGWFELRGSVPVRRALRVL